VKVTGSWIGQYTYGAGYGEGIAGTSVPFMLSLTENWLGKVSGYVRDDASRGGMPERGRILGTRKRDELRFVKSMPNHYFTDANRKLVDLRSAWREQGVEPPAELPPHRIGYRGTLGADGETIAGEWAILPWQVDTDEERIEFGSGQGTWTAKRTSFEPSAV
jgi:hypothetical protein